MTTPALARFAVYRDRRPFDPEYLGDVLARDAQHARDMGRVLSGAVVVVLRVGTGTPGSRELLRVTAERLARVVPSPAPRRRRPR